MEKREHSSLKGCHVLPDSLKPSCSSRELTVGRSSYRVAIRDGGQHFILWGPLIVTEQQSDLSR